MSGGVSPKLQCCFRIAGEEWLLEGLDAASLGTWVRDVRACDLDTSPKVRVRVRLESSAARKAGVSGSPGGGCRLRAEEFACEVSASLDTIEVRGVTSALADGVRAGVRLGALLRCLSGGGLALHASCVACEDDGRGDARAFVLAGPSGAGKTTAASHAAAAGARILADDLVLLRRDKGAPEWRASGLPWETHSDPAGRAIQRPTLVPEEPGAARRRSAPGANAPVRAAALVRIVPAPEYALARLRGARAAAVSLACPPESLGVETGRIVMSTARMVDELPVFRAELPEGSEAVARMLDEVGEAAAEESPRD